MPFFLTILGNWRTIAIITTVLACFSGGWYVKGRIADHVLESRLKEQESILIGQCNDDKKITEKANDDIQIQLSTISKRLAAAKRLPPRCVQITPSMAIDPSGGGKHARQDGLSSEWLKEYAAECETYRSEVIILDDFGRKNCQ